MTSVLVVDDDQDLAEMLGIVLNGVGMEVDLVSRGDEAIEVFKNSNDMKYLLRSKKYPIKIVKIKKNKKKNKKITPNFFFQQNLKYFIYLT